MSTDTSIKNKAEMSKATDHIPQDILDDLLPKKATLSGKIWMGFLLIIMALGFAAYVHQLKKGLIITDMRDFTSWGIYISNFVFFVAISLVGSLISAVLKLTNVQWRTPLVRISEIIAVAAITFAAIIIIVDMGRPERFWHLFVYGRIQSPIMWDVIVITTYFVVSLLLLYLPLLPDLAICRDRLTHLPKWKKWFYRFFALNWKNTPRQHKLMNDSIRILAVLIIPLALSIHTVTSWLFATTYRAGWDSTNFGPYFVSGAFMVGAAGVIAVMFVLRIHNHLQKYITNKHFDNMGKLLVLLSLIYLYFNINEYFVPGYKMKLVEGEHLKALFTGDYAPLFWSVQILGMIVPIIVLLFKKGRKPIPIFIISVMVVIGAWFKRFLIVAPTLLHPFIPIQNVPESWHHYNPTLEEWAITGASLAGALFIISLFSRIFPVVSIWEAAEEREMESNNLSKANSNE